MFVEIGHIVGLVMALWTTERFLSAMTGVVLFEGGPIHGLLEAHRALKRSSFGEKGVKVQFTVRCGRLGFRSVQEIAAVRLIHVGGRTTRNIVSRRP